LNIPGANLRSHPRIVPNDLLLQFGYSPGDSGIRYDSAADALNFLHGGVSKFDLQSFGLNLRDGHGLVVGHSSQVTTNVPNEFQVLGTSAADSRATIGRWSASASSPVLDFVKSRSAAIGSNTIVQNGDELGQMVFRVDDGTDFDSTGASIAAFVDGVPGANDTPGRLVFFTTKDGASSVTEALRIDSSQSVYIGDSATTDSAVGLTLNQGANDDFIFTLKSSDVDHGDFAGIEGDTFFALKKQSATLGGVLQHVFAEDGAISTPYNILVVGGTPNTAKSSNGLGLMNIDIREHDGAGASANITADGNIFAVRAYVGGFPATRFLVDEDGDLYSTTAAQTFDDYDDLALIETYDAVRSDPSSTSLKEGIKASFGKVMLMNEETLIEAGVLGAPISEGGLTNQTQLMRVLTGGLRQADQRIKQLEGQMLALTEGK